VLCYDGRVLARWLLALVSTALWLAPHVARGQSDDDPFEVVEIASDGRTVAAEIADFDGDGRADLLQIVFAGAPPTERRRIRVWPQDESGKLALQPKYDVAVPEDSAAYDVGDVTDLPGTELVLLRPNGLAILSFSNAGLPRRDLPVDGPTLAPTEDERGLDRLRMIYGEFGPEPWLMVPMLARTAFVSPAGETRALLDVGARANYFMPQRPGPLLVDSDIQLLLDVPRISVGDVNGDGHPDVVGSGRHEVRTFLRKPDGSFAREPSREYKLALVTERDHIRGSGSVRGEARDVSGDGKLDLLISNVAGGLTDAKSQTRLYLNRDGGWDLANPDLVLDGGAGWGADQLIDLDNDGKSELMHVSIPFSVLELVEALVTRSVDAQVSVYKSDGAGGFAKKPWFTRKLSIAMSLETGRPKGFVPTGNFDVNDDGFPDLLASGEGDRLEVWLGGSEGLSSDTAGDQEMPSNGRLRVGEWNGDGLPDFVLYDPRELEAPVRIARNRGILPGTLPRIGQRGVGAPRP
jgi:hypothetical protein